MPLQKNTGQVYLPTGVPQSSVETAQFRNELGQLYQGPSGVVWQKVQMDTVAPTVVPAVGLVLYMKSRANWIVTTDIAEGENDRNTACGFIAHTDDYPDAVVPGTAQYFWMIVEGDDRTAQSDIANWAVGDQAISSSANARVARVAIGTAPTHKLLGYCHTAVNLGAAGKVKLDINVPRDF